MGWWPPFGRKKRKAREADDKAHARLVSERHSAPPPQLEPLYDRPRSPHLSAAFPQFSDEPADSSPTPAPPIPPRAKRVPEPLLVSDLSKADEITALPKSPKTTRAQNAPVSPPLRQVNDSELNIAPRSPPLLRPKSSKRYAESRRREEEAKAMTQTQPIPIPKRPGADSPQLFRRESKKRRGADLATHFHDPSSITSFPPPSSVRSSMTGMSESHRIDVGIVDILSPRPTLRYSVQGPPRSSAPSRADSKRPVSKRTAKGRDTDRDRIDEQADDMDTHTIRELMDRDQRRSERRRKGERDRARRRLDNLAARGEEEDAATRKAEASRKAVDDQQPGPSGDLKEYQTPPVARLQPPSADQTQLTIARSSLVDLALSRPRTPPKETHPALRSLPDDPEPEPTPMGTGHASPPESPTQPAPVSAADMRRRSTKSAKSGKSGKDASEATSYGRRDSQRSVKRSGALAALFRRSGLGSKREEHRAPPSERSFSNTSRESMSRPVPPPLPIMPAPLYRPLSGTATSPGVVPSSTRSKFREDLPESPMSPDSRFQAPGNGEGDSAQALPRDLAMARLAGAGYITDGAQQGHSRNQSYDSTGPSAEVLSQSLASVGSEGSWLAGSRPRARTSQQMSIARSSLRQPVEDSTEDDQGTPRQSEDGAGTGFEEETEKPVVREAVSRRPTITNRPVRVSSQEGLLNQYDAGAAPKAVEADYFGAASEAASEATSVPTSGVASPDISAAQDAKFAQVAPGFALQRARSVKAGDAKLLDIARAQEQASEAARPSTPPLHGAETPMGI